MKSFLIALFVIALFGCFEQEDFCKEEKGLIRFLEPIDSVAYFRVKDLVFFTWDTLFVVSGPTIDNEVQSIIGVNYDKVIKDGEVNYYFMREGSIILDFSTYCTLNLELCNNKNWTSYSPRDSLKLNCSQVGLNKTYEIHPLTND